MYTGYQVNSTPLWIGKAAVAIDDVRNKAVKFSNGEIAVCDTAGEPAIGIAIITNDTGLIAGDDVTFQIKDIGIAVAGGAVAIGDELATDNTGKLVKAAAGQFIIGTALTAATSSGQKFQVEINKLGYKPAGA